ncbi:MAG: phosphatase [Frankiaceae bacterium]
MTVRTLPSRAELRDHLLMSGLAGRVQTPRESNIGNIRLMLDRHHEYAFGLELDRPWSHGEVLALLAERVGISPDPSVLAGPDTIDPDRCLDGLDAMAARLQQAAARRERVVVATGHPSGICAVHLAVAAALRHAGCQVLTPAEGQSCPLPGSGYREIRWLGGVGMLSDRGGLAHTHSPLPMETVLRALAAEGDQPPDLVVADHGWSGAAGQAGIDTVGFADCNDPALFVGAAEGKVTVAVPIDDNVLPLRYGPVAAYLLAGWAHPVG